MKKKRTRETTSSGSNNTAVTVGDGTPAVLVPPFIEAVATGNGLHDYLHYPFPFFDNNIPGPHIHQAESELSAKTRVHEPPADKDAPPAK